jgi:hypothetical protein
MHMSEEWLETIAWLVVLAVIAGVFWLLARDRGRARRRTAEEFERELAENRGALLRAGALGLEKVLSDSRRKAIEYRLDQKSGTTKTGSKGDDAHRTETVDGERKEG